MLAEGRERFMVRTTNRRLLIQTLLLWKWKQIQTIFDDISKMIVNVSRNTLLTSSLCFFSGLLFLSSQVESSALPSTLFLPEVIKPCASEMAFLLSKAEVLCALLMVGPEDSSLLQFSVFLTLASVDLQSPLRHIISCTAP